ncbi:MAG: DUF3084 domain-containing protein [Scytonematopsis contorta HA4267-MV1]|jgi:uncharacterized protein (DUF3084 family)|nr:DUF3084 domain-containing protein [Scytonematopsis contorta HA4267-MV1]
MATGFILIAAILILGGVIATLGDRIGTRVGKARLSLFKLRPKNTAVLVTYITGTLISASTLAILFTVDDKLKQGVFELEKILTDLRLNKEQLKVAQEQKNKVQKNLEQSQQELQRIDRNLQEANEKQKKTQQQLNQTRTDLRRTVTQQVQTQNQLQLTRTELGRVAQQYQQVVVALRDISEQRKSLIIERKGLAEEITRLKAERQNFLDRAKKAIGERDRELANRQETIDKSERRITELNRLITKRNQEIKSREQIIGEREQTIAQTESRLKDLETQQNYLEKEVAKLEKYYQSYRDLRLGKLALIRGQVLSSGVVRVEDLTRARSAVIQILQEANRYATTELSEPGINSPNGQVLYVTQEQVEQLSRQISKGKEYVVRIVSAGNYVRGEKRIEFFADTAQNQKMFTAGEILAGTSANPKTMTSYQLKQRLELLISASQFRARNAGILNDLQIDGSLIRFVAQLRQYDQQIEIKAIAAEDTYTAGPLRVRLIGIQNGEIIFST